MQHLSHIFNEMDESSDRLEIVMESPYFKITKIGAPHSETSIEIKSKTKTKLIMKSMKLARKESIRTDSSDLLDITCSNDDTQAQNHIDEHEHDDDDGHNPKLNYQHLEIEILENDVDIIKVSDSEDEIEESASVDTSDVLEIEKFEDSDPDLILGSKRAPKKDVVQKPPTPQPTSSRLEYLIRQPSTFWTPNKRSFEQAKGNTQQQQPVEQAIEDEPTTELERLLRMPSTSWAPKRRFIEQVTDNVQHQQRHQQQYQQQKRP